MTDVSRQELISAYLDGELSADERARVESWLAENPELRQFYDELVSLRSGMQSLPRHELEGDLAPSILRRIAEESRRAGGSSVKQPAARGSQVERPAVVPASRWWDRGAGWRRALWPAVAVAAALAVLVYDARQRPEEQQVALAPESAAETQAAPAVVPAELDSPDAENLVRQAPGDAFAVPPAPSQAANDRSYGRAAKEPYMRRSAAPAQSAAQEPAGAGSPRREAPQFAPAPTLGAPASAMNAEVKLSDDRSPPMQAVVVTQQYFKDNEFEKLLKSQRIGYERVDVPPNASYAMPQAAPAAKPVQMNLYAGDNQSLRAGYVLQCNDAQAGQVLSQVPYPRNAASNGLVVPQQAGKKSASEGEFRVLLLAPAESPAAPGKSNN